MSLESLEKIITNTHWPLLSSLNVCLVLVLGYIINKAKIKLFARLTKQIKITQITAIDVFFYAVNQPITALIWLMAITISLHIMEFGVDKPALAELIEHSSKVGIILILVWSGNRFINRTENEILEQRWKHARVDRTSTLAIGKLSRVIIYLSGALIILPTIGIPISGVLALGGVGGIAVGFAAKEMIANFLGGAMLYVERPFSVNDSIELPEKDITGKISNIGWRTTKIRMLDRRVMYVPNSTFAITHVINESKRSHFRIHETISLRYSDIKVLPNIITELKAMLKNHPDVDQKDIVHVSFTEFGESTLKCLLWCFVNKTTKLEYLQSLEDILFKTYAIISANGAEIAYPTSVVIAASTT